MDQAQVSVEDDLPETTEGLVHLWFGYHNVSSKTFDTFTRGLSIHKVSVGLKHCAFLTSNGEVYMYGNNQCGQLGTGDIQDQFDEPVYVEALKDVVVIDISCGAKHSAAVTSTGHVFCWGDSTQGQCGENQNTHITSPVKIDILWDKVSSNQADVKLGDNTLSRSNKFERNRRSMSLGCEEEKIASKNKGSFIRQSTEIVEANGLSEKEHYSREKTEVKIVQVACGSYHTVAISEHGELWVWGTGLPLGLNLTENSQLRVPQRIDFLIGRKVLQVSCGASHTLALVQKLPVSGNFYQPENVLAKSKLPKSELRKNQRKESRTVNTREESAENMCEKCHSPLPNAKYDVNEDEMHQHTCPLGLEISKQEASKMVLSKLIGSESIKSALDSQSLDTDSTCSEVDQSGAAIYLTAENSPQKENINIAEQLADPCSMTDVNLSETDDSNKSKERIEHSNLSDNIEENNTNIANKSDTSDIIQCSSSQSKENCDTPIEQNSIANNSSHNEPKPDNQNMQNNQITCDTNIKQNMSSAAEETNIITVHEKSSTEDSNKIDGNIETSFDRIPIKESSMSANQTDSQSNMNSLECHPKDSNLQMTEIDLNVDGNTSSSAVLEISESVELKPFTQSISKIENVDIKNENDSVFTGASVMKDGKMKVLTSRNSSDSLVGGIPKSRSTFLDEEEAKEFLDRQLSGEDILPQVDEDGNMVVLAKKVENILQYVPNTSTAIAMQEYVTSWTKNVVTNIKSSVETTMDKFGIVPSLGSSMDEDEGDRGRGQSSSLSENENDNDTAKLEQMGDFPRYGTLPKSTSLGGNKLKTAGRTHRRKGSLPTGAITATNPGLFRCSEVVVDTEVWSWGHGEKGQLGHADHLHRLQPCKVKFFSDKKVVNISSGAYHNVVLTANSQVYSWGCNESGQLGHDDGTIITKPCLVKVGDGFTVFDVAAGDHHSVVIADGLTNNPQVFFTGRQPGKTEGKEDSVTKYTLLSYMQKVGWIKSVSAGGELSACISDKNNTASFIGVLHEFTASERQFGAQLHFVADNILKPLLASDSFQSKDSSQLGMALGLLCDAFMCINDMISLNHLEGSQVISGTRELTKLQLLCKSEQCIGVYLHYCKCFTDVLSIGGFKTCAQLCSSILDKCKDQIKTVLTMKTYNSKEVGNVFLKLMKIPFNRLKDYCKMLGRLALKFPSYTSEKQILDKSSQVWERFRQTSTLDINQAENTNKFWLECPYKLSEAFEDPPHVACYLTEALKTPTRRLLFDSKSHPINLQSSGRFSSHRFILFNDIFAHIQGSYHSTYQLPTIWLQTSSSELDVPGNFIRLIMPEDILTLTAPSPTLKSEWVWAFNQAIDRALCQQRHHVDRRSGLSTLSPPRDRHASYFFTKHPAFKDAKYEGMWRMGVLYGQGELQWTDGRKFVGAFKDGCQDGYGIYTVPQEGEREVYEGMWRNGRLGGYGFIRYPNGDSYEGLFRDGKRHGHGTLKQGKLTSTLASIYIGEWCMDKKSGYGVYEDILKGQKYMGLWLDDQKHGNGVIVTIDGMYFEGTFQQNKMTGYGLLMTEDNSCYEGEFSGGPNLAGKGILTLPNGDYIEGTFNGSFSEGIKVNGTFYKCPEGASIQQHGFSHALGLIPKSYGKLSVPAQRKWEEVFDHCCGMLGVTKDCARTDPSKAWEKCAAFIEIGKKMSACTKRSPRLKSKHSAMSGILETIPEYNRGQLSVEYYANIKAYVEKAFECPFHPLGKLLESLVDVYRATYVGVGAHPRLLHHAVLEVRSFIDRIYPIVRILFPDLPDGNSLVQIFCEYVDQNVNFEDAGEEICEVVTSGSLLYPLLLPKIYPPLFTLYALYNEKADEQYWRRIVSWNKQSDLALMSYLGVDQKLWTFEEHNIESPQRLSKLRDKCYIEAVETLQGMSTSFSPADKLYLIQSTFNRINKVVQDRLGLQYLWCMDDLFPVFQYVVVRSRIQHLGAEIHFMDDLMEPHLEHGELGLMFTTLKASYYQIQNEKIA